MGFVTHLVGVLPRITLNNELKDDEKQQKKIGRIKQLIK